MRVKVACVMGVVLILAGCSKKDCGPQTYPVSGEVFRRGKPVTSGTVQFVHQTEPNIRAVGEIGPDGKFVLCTLVGNENRSGAVVGEYKAVLVLSAQDPAFHPKTMFKVEPQVNTFKIELP